MAANRQYIAAVENFNKVEGDYAQFEQSTFNDMKKRRLLPDNMTWEQVKSDPAKYDYVVDTYWDDLTNTFGIPANDEYAKAIWWLMPGRYKKTGGDIEKLDGKWKPVMRSRVKNLDLSIKGGR